LNSKSVEIKQDSLLDSFVLYTKLFHKPFTAEALLAGLPMSDGSEPQKLFSVGSSKSLFSRVAARAGLKSTLIERPISKMLQLQLPVILLLANDYSCILESFSKDRKMAKIIYPDGDGIEKWISVEDLEKEYLGFAFLLKKEFEYSESNTKTLELEQKHWFWSTIKRSSGLYRDVIVASFLINLFVLATPLFTMNVFDRVIPNNAQETLMVFTIGIVIVYLLDFFLKFTRNYLLEIAGKKSDIIMSSIIFEKILDLKMSSHPGSVGSFASNIKNFDAVRSFFTTATLTAVVDFPFTIIFLLVVYYIAGIMVLIPITVMVLILIVALALKKPLKKNIENSQVAGAKKNSILIETLQNIETVKTMGMAGRIQWEWEEASGEIANKGMRTRLLASAIPNITHLLTQLNRILIIVIGVYMIQNFELTMGGLIATMILGSRAVSPMGRAAALISNYSDAKAAYHTLNDIILRPSERPSGHKFLERPALSGKIEFKDVTFTYPGADVPAISNVSFVVEPGEKVAIIGRIGSGKSTISKLLLRLYEPDSGSILLDDIDIAQIDPADLRRSISYVPQDIHLFNGTIKENIISSGKHPSDEDVLRASIISGTDEFVHNHPKGYDMPIGERGAGLSGGQRQSVGVARALLEDGSMYLMDEPTNGMDQMTETKLINNLKAELKDKTLFVVTQKATLLNLVDRVIVMNKSKLLLDGKKNEVTKKLSGGSNV